MHHTPNLTPRAMAAIIRQIDQAADCEAELTATVNGVDRNFYASFASESEVERGDWPNSDFIAVDRKCVGAWCEEDDFSFAGNRDELAALIGEAAVKEWEAKMYEAKSMGEWQ